MGGIYYFETEEDAEAYKVWLLDTLSQQENYSNISAEIFDIFVEPSLANKSPHV